MDSKTFDSLVDFICEERVKKVLCNKAKEYANRADRLHNFKRSAEIDGITPIEALRGMDLKHRTSISDMLDDIKNIQHSRQLWEEKITDHVNYCILLWALLVELYDWSIKDASNKG